MEPQDIENTDEIRNGTIGIVSGKKKRSEVILRGWKENEVSDEEKENGFVEEPFLLKTFDRQNYSLERNSGHDRDRARHLS